MRMLLLVVALLMTAPAWAVEPSERLADPALEARARSISSELRCLVCQNESIDESHADLAHDIRVLVRERLSAGDTNAAARQAVVDRYGEFVLLRPRIEPATYVLWFGPVGLLVLGFGATRIYIAGDTEDIPEMRALKDITIAFLPMNLPFTMTVEQAASAVEEFKPVHVYPYHYKGQDPQKFADLVKSSQVGLLKWYDE